MRGLVLVFAALACVSLVGNVAGDDATRLTVMTYNVLYGAGVNAEDERIANRWSNGKYHGNRLDSVMAVIKHVKPDILGIEEACHWDLNDDATAKQVAKALGMRYFVGKSTRSRFSVALFSRLPIVSAKTFPDQFSRAAIEAEIRLPDGRRLHTFVGHFDLARNKQSQMKETRFLAGRMRPYADRLGIFMGDTNSVYVEGKDTTEALRSSGFLMAPTIKGIDQIWVSKPLLTGVTAGPTIPTTLTNGVSDHRPSAVVITIPPAAKP